MAASASRTADAGNGARSSGSGRSRRIAELDGKRIRIAVEQEPGSGGKESAEATIRNLAGWRVVADRPTGDKAVRAGPYAAQVQGGNVLLVKGAWTKAFIDEHIAFPVGRAKDQVDAAAAAFNLLTLRKNNTPAVVPIRGLCDDKATYVNVLPCSLAAALRYRTAQRTLRSSGRRGRVRIIGYERVSTARQGASGLGIEAQRQAIDGFVAHKKATLIARFTEVESGRNPDRPELGRRCTSPRSPGRRWSSPSSTGCRGTPPSCSRSGTAACGSPPWTYRKRTTSQSASWRWWRRRSARRSRGARRRRWRWQGAAA